MYHERMARARIESLAEEDVINKAIERGVVKPDRWLILLITEVISPVAVALVIYLLASS
jgi:hypothetical protein